MLGFDTVGQVTVKELHRRLEGKQPLVLLDTLPADHFNQVHLPGSVNACVFEVTFLEQVRAITADKGAEIIVYGSSVSTLDAQVAADKLIRDGYQRVAVLYGGLDLWRQSGFHLEGLGADSTDEPQTLLRLVDRRYRVVPEKSSVGWKGRNASSCHQGTVAVTGGEISVHRGELTGFLEVNMNSIANDNLAGSELQAVLEDHLKSVDFFHTRRFATAGLQILSGRPVKTPYLTAQNVEFKSMLELRGVRAELGFPATVTNETDGSLAIEAHFDLDRTKWNIIYGSTRYFEHLGMHRVFEAISIELRIGTE